MATVSHADLWATIAVANVAELVAPAIYGPSPVAFRLDQGRKGIASIAQT